MKFLRFSEIHKQNGYSETQKATAQTKVYENAEEKLKHRTFAEKWHPVKEFFIKVRNCYPFVSVGLGVIISIGGAMLLVESFPLSLKILSGVLIFVFSLAIISGFELLKIKSAKEVFGENDTKFIPALLLFFGISVGISVGGGYLGTVYGGDKTEEITQNFTQKNDSIREIYLAQIKDYELTIESANQQLQKTKTGWKANTARKDLKEAQTAKSELLKQIESKSEELATIQKNEINTASDLLEYKAYIICLIVLIFELFYIFSFWFEYYIERKIKTENRNHSFVPHEEYDTPFIKNASINTNHVSNGMDLQNMMQTLQQLQSLQIALNSVQNPDSNTPKPVPFKATKKVGFQFTKSDKTIDVKRPRNNDKETLNDPVKRQTSYGIGECAECGEPFSRKTWNHKFCSDECRIKNWEAKTGGKVTKRKGGAK